ncbi:unnamed protein product [Phytophthora fragariaefolia]|uniref:Unnamed protein product n=1 Tax=Phytophthora fragariaefolia TaxID=1490495 RepID=A0A9W7DD37_9STRA|nr:unnamed protein product [Phytophthora fragariaefolia]
MELWVANIGEGVDVLLGMNFMYSAGVRRAREGLVKLPDEETVLLVGRTADHMGRGLDLAVTPKTCLYLGPGESAVVRIDYGQSNPQREVVWAGRGDRWVTQIIYAAKSWPVAVKVVNISDKTVWIDSRTAVTRIVEFGFFPTTGRFVRPGLRRYKEWQALIYEKSVEKTGGSHEDTGNSGEILKDRGPVVVLDEDSDSDYEAFYDAISFDGDDGDEDSQEVVEAEPSTGMSSDRLQLPVRKLEEAYERCMQMSAEELSLEPAVYIHEGSELLAQLRDELAMLPELQELSPECDISKADVGEPGRTTPAEEEKLRTRLRYHHRIFLGDGNAAPAPAQGMWCDLDVGDAKPVAQRPRSIVPHLAIKVYELLKKLLETGLIEHSGSPWASPIVIVLKKNGVDIRMCIDYRVVNGFIQLSNYPLPLIDDLLIGFERAMWFMSLDMASGFWAIRMTERAKLISAFVSPFGHFQWVRMPFGLKNAPLVYQAVINNCLWVSSDCLQKKKPRSIMMSWSFWD